MKLLELQEALGERIRIACDSSLSDEERKNENEKSETVVRLAKQTISDANTALRKIEKP